VLQPDEREKLERGFIEAEASLFLSGLTVSENFLTIKARILSGEITIDQGQKEILAYYRVKNSSVGHANS
jgi:hypothetical protein